MTAARTCCLLGVVLVATGSLNVGGCEPVWQGKLFLSPDGRTLALTAPAPATQPQSLLLLARDGERIGRTDGLAKTAADREPAFSPDSKSLAFWRVAMPPQPGTEDLEGVLGKPASVELVLLPVKGGPPGQQRALLRWQTALQLDIWLAAGSPPRFSPDGRTIAVGRIGDSPDKLDPHVELIDAATAAARRIAEDCFDPRFVADGRELIVLTLAEGTKKWIAKELAEKAAAKDKPESDRGEQDKGPKILAVRFDIASGREVGRWPCPEGLNISEQTARDGPIGKVEEAGLVRIDPASGRTSPLWPAPPGTFAFSPDGRFVLAVGVAAEAPAPATQPEQETDSPPAAPIPPLPPGQENADVLYLFDRDAPTAGWRKLRQTAWPVRIQQPRVSADGHTVCFIQYDNGYRQVQGERDKKKVAPEQGRLIVLDVPSGKAVCDRDLLGIAAAATQPD